MAILSTLTHIGHLPREITLDIMSRLPAESVIRCMSVCRRWRYLLLVNHNDFVRMHLQQQKQQIISRGGQFDFLIKFNPDKYTTRVQEFEFLEYIDAADDDSDDDSASKLFGKYRVRKVDHPLMINDRYLHKHLCPNPFRNNISREISRRRMIFDHYVQAVGSCNGIVCVSYFDDPTYICNPVTKEYINLPIHNRFYTPSCNSIIASTSYIVSGFGYHPRNPDEYKVVRIYYSSSRVDCEGQVEVYTIGKDQGRWRKKGPISHMLKGQRGVLVNGTLYWMTTTMYGVMSDQLGIVAFDLAEEEFYEVGKVPAFDTQQQMVWPPLLRPLRIRELGGCLSIIHLITGNSTDVWMMKDCTRNNESWVKEFSIPENWNNCDPFNLTKNGEILAWSNDQNHNIELSLTSYNPTTGIARTESDESDESDETMITINSSYGAVAHIKSFISLEDLGEEDVRRVQRHEKVLKASMPRKRKASSRINIDDLM